MLFKALLPRISVLLLARMAGLPAVKIESPVDFVYSFFIIFYFIFGGKGEKKGNKNEKVT